MASLGDVRFKVRTEDLETKAGTVSSIIQKMESNFRTISDIMDKTKGYWIGDAAEKHRKMYDNRKKQEVEVMMKRLKEHPKDLLTIAGVYKSTEADNVTVSKGLPTNVIS